MTLRAFDTYDISGALSWMGVDDQHSGIQFASSDWADPTPEQAENFEAVKSGVARIGQDWKQLNEKTSWVKKHPSDLKVGEGTVTYDEVIICYAPYTGEE